jgi:hypothetical protein
MSTVHINELREQLLETLKDLRNREQPMEPDRARAVAQVASVLVDSAKVEVDYLKITGQDRAGFLEQPPQITSDSSTSGVPKQGTIEHFPGGMRHKLRG